MLVVFTFGGTLFRRDSQTPYLRWIKLCKGQDRNKVLHQGQAQATDGEMEMMIRLEFPKALQDIIMLFLELFCAQSKVPGWPLSPAQGCWNLEQFSASLDVYLCLSSAFPERGRNCGFLSTSCVPGMVPNIWCDLAPVILLSELVKFFSSSGWNGQWYWESVAMMAWGGARTRKSEATEGVAIIITPLCWAGNWPQHF